LNVGSIHLRFCFSDCWRNAENNFFYYYLLCSAAVRSSFIQGHYCKGAPSPSSFHWVSCCLC